MFPVLELFCRSVWCGTVQNRAQDRGWAPLNMSYSNRPSASSASRPSAHSAPPLFSPPRSRRASPPPLLLFFSGTRRPPPFSASSSSPAPLPPAASSWAGSTPCSPSPSPSCPGNGVRLGAPARRCTAGFLPEVLATLLEMWMRQQMAGQVVSS